MPSDPLFALIADTFSKLGAGPSPVLRTLLLRDRHFVGHCYRCGDCRAVWKPDDPVVQFFGADGQLAMSVRQDQADVKAA